MTGLKKKIAAAAIVLFMAACSGPVLTNLKYHQDMDIAFRSLVPSDTPSGRFLVPDLAGGSLDVTVRRLDQGKVIFQEALSLVPDGAGWLEGRARVKVPLNVELRIQAFLKDPAGLVVSTSDAVFSADQKSSELPTPVYLIPTENFPGLVPLDSGGVMEENLIVQDGKTRIIALVVEPQDVGVVKKISWAGTGSMDDLIILLRNPRGQTSPFVALNGELTAGLQFQPEMAGVHYIIIHNRLPSDGAAPEDKDLGKASAPVSVSFQGNGHTAGGLPQGLPQATSGQTLVIPGPGDLAKDGYKFSGWNTRSDGTGTDYRPGDVLTVGKSDVVLYAQWTKIITVTVTYHGNGHTGGSVPAPHTGAVSDVSLTVAGPGDMVKGGFLFSGWTFNQDGTGDVLLPGTAFIPGTSDRTLYALWSPVEAVKARLEYQGNGSTGGAVPAGAGNLDPGSVLTVEEPGTLVKAGYYFTGWNTAWDGTGTSYLPGDEFLLEHAVHVLYAQWAPLAGQSVEVSLEDPEDPDPVLTGVEPVLTRGSSLTVTVTGPEWGYYRWTLAGQGTLPEFTGETSGALTVTAGPQTSLGVYTLTIWFGTSGAEFSKSLSLQVVE